jgi:hypothetical protein
MKDFIESYICHKLRVGNPSKIEIEAKKKLSPVSARKLKKHFSVQKGVKHIKSAVFMDQFVDTPDYDIFHSGASLRIRYKGDGANVYVQYKGHGFSYKGILFRSEFSSGRIKGLVREESHHDIIHFAGTGLKELLEKFVPAEMRAVITSHLGLSVIQRVRVAPVICFYRKDKYLVELGKVALEPSLDHVSAFHIAGGAFHSLSNFWEYENEIKSRDNDLQGKLSKLDVMTGFDAELAKKFHLQPEAMDKYHRVLSCFTKPAAGKQGPFAEVIRVLGS